MHLMPYHLIQLLGVTNAFEADSYIAYKVLNTCEYSLKTKCLLQSAARMQHALRQRVVHGTALINMLIL